MTRKPKAVLEEQRQERRIGQFVIFFYDLGKGAVAKAKDNWKWLLVALMFLINSPYAMSALELATGWSFGTKLQAAAPPTTLEAPTGEPWKEGVNRKLADVNTRLGTVEKQQKIIIKLLTE